MEQVIRNNRIQPGRWAFEHRGSGVRLTLKRGRDLEVGDSQHFLGNLHRISELSPYVPTPGLPDDYEPPGTRSARWEGMGNGMVINPNDWYEVGA